MTLDGNNCLFQFTKIEIYFILRITYLPIIITLIRRDFDRNNLFQREGSKTQNTLQRIQILQTMEYLVYDLLVLLLGVCISLKSDRNQIGPGLDRN